MHRLRKLLALSWTDRALLLEAALALTATRAALAVIPFRQLVSWLGLEEGTAGSVDLQVAQKVGWALAVAGNHLPLGSSCLCRAVAGKLMLDRRHVPCAVVLGVRGPGRDFAAHAWLRAGDLIVSGAGTAADYAELARFS